MLVGGAFLVVQIPVIQVLLVQRTLIKNAAAVKPFHMKQCLFTPNLAKSTPNIDLVLPKMCLVQLIIYADLTFLCHYVASHSLALLHSLKHEFACLFVFFLFFFVVGGVVLLPSLFSFFVGEHSS